MSLTRPLILAAGLLGLTACSTFGPEPTGFNQTFVGVWTVAHAWPAGSVIGPPPEGQTVAITPTTAVDPMGRSCTAPTYTITPGSLTAALGAAAPSSEQGLMLDILCEGSPFVRYVANGTRLLAVSDGWLFELRPAATMAAMRQIPVMPAAATSMPTPPVATMAMAAPAPAHRPTPVKHTAKRVHQTTSGDLYLASYRSQDTASAGWRVMQRQASALKGLQATFKEVDLGSKGRYVRLYAVGASAEAKSRICSALGHASPDCGARY